MQDYKIPQRNYRAFNMTQFSLLIGKVAQENHKDYANGGD